MTQPIVSIIIPSYNAEKFVGEAIQSALDQTYSDFEVIIIDDGSAKVLRDNLTIGRNAG